METPSNFLIKTDDYFNFIELDQEDKYQQYLDMEEYFLETETNIDNNDNNNNYNNNKKGKFILDESDFNIDLEEELESRISDLVEQLEEKNYMMKEQEIKFKIFDDISSVSKNSDNKLELILTIPKSSDIMTINKIKLSKNIKQYVFDIFITLNNNIILNKDIKHNEKILLSKSNSNIFDYANLFENKNHIDCSKGDVNIHIVLEPNSINEIINNNIYINYSFANYKNKVKFFY